MMAEKRDELRRYVVTPLQTNCYAYVSDGECLVVDPGGSGTQIAAVLDDVRVRCVAATHGHGDHVGGVSALVRATGAPFAIHGADAELASRAGEMSEVGRSYDENAPAPDRTLAEGDVISVGSATFTVMETPGHTPGGSYSWGREREGLAFVGDTLFPAAMAAQTSRVATRRPSWPRSPAWPQRLLPRRRCCAGTAPPPRWRASSPATPSCPTSARVWVRGRDPGQPSHDKTAGYLFEM